MFAFLILFFVFQKLTLTCEHRRPEADPHPFCEPCAVAEDLELCVPANTCVWCQNVSKLEWRTILAARRKREKRLVVKLNSPSKSTASSLSPRRSTLSTPSKKSKSADKTAVRRSPRKLQLPASVVRRVLPSDPPPLVTHVLGTVQSQQEAEASELELCPTALLDKDVTVADIAAASALASQSAFSQAVSTLMLSFFCLNEC